MPRQQRYIGSSGLHQEKSYGASWRKPLLKPALLLAACCLLLAAQTGCGAHSGGAEIGQLAQAGPADQPKPAAADANAGGGAAL
ncbi:MAG TPA: hypothetical protein VGJ15_08780, partial [Pirellulales bacterium]